MSLQPNNKIDKFLISTTSRFTGRYEKNGILLTHSWADYKAFDKRGHEGPASRNAFVFVHEVESDETNLSPHVTTGQSMGNLICSYLSVLFGKRFDNHGAIESFGQFFTPDMVQFNQLCNHGLPQNSYKSRVDFSLDLKLSEVKRIDSLLHNKRINEKFLRTFQSAAKFYLLALQNAENDPEVAYLHLITAGEILSYFYDFEKSELYDEETKEILTLIESNLDEGHKVSRIIADKIFHVKKRFLKTILNLVDSNFFQSSESNQTYGRFTKDTFKQAVASAYDLRSQYVHTGATFGDRVMLSAGGNNFEILFGVPVIENKNLKKCLSKAPTYIGLERVIRFSLLRFAQKNDAFVFP